MNRTTRHPRELSELPTSYLVVPAVIWSVVVAAALIGTPSNDVASQSAKTNEVAASVEGA